MEPQFDVLERSKIGIILVLNSLSLRRFGPLMLRIDGRADGIAAFGSRIGWRDKTLDARRLRPLNLSRRIVPSSLVRRTTCDRVRSRFLALRAAFSTETHVFT
jgi:hypothetical protein